MLQVLIVVLLVTASSAWTRPPDAALTQFRHASLKLQLWEADGHKGTPTLSDPDAAPLLRAAFDQRALLNLGDLGLSATMEICEIGGETSRRYAAPEAALALQDEFAGAQSFNLGCYGILAPLTEAFWVSLPPTQRTKVRRDGLRSLQLGMAQMYLGAVLLQTPIIRQPNRDLMLDTALRNADAISRLLDPSSRQKIINAIDMMGGSAAPEARDRLARLRKAILAAPCGPLCNA